MKRKSIKVSGRRSSKRKSIKVSGRRSSKRKSIKVSGRRSSKRKSKRRSLRRRIKGGVKELPVEMIDLISGYLSPKDKMSLSYADKEMRGVMVDLKRLDINLNKEYSLKYYEDVDYRNKIDSRYKKIGVNLYGCEGVTDVSMLGNVHTLDLRGCVNVTNANVLVGKVPKLTLP